MMKTIGIIIRPFWENDIEYVGSRADLFDALKEFPVNVIGIPINEDFSKIINIVELCDGIILSGGNKFHDNDFKLVKYLYEKNIPTLGICLGMQSMVEAFNNEEEIKVDNHYSKEYYVHKVFVNKDSKLYEIIGKEHILVNSRHHTAVKNTHFKINALSDDGIIEGIEDINHPYFLGVQWHPESIKDDFSYKLYKSFLNHL